MQPLAPVPARPRRMIALVRVSMDSDAATSPEIQEHAIRAHASARNDTIVDWVYGIDESGSDRKSAWWGKLDDAITRVEQGEADGIIVWRYSRTARHRLRWAVALDRLDVIGAAIESATEPTEQNPSGRLQRGMLGEFNAYQAELIGEGWREAHTRRVRAGQPATGGDRFG